MATMNALLSIKPYLPFSYVHQGERPPKWGFFQTFTITKTVKLDPRQNEHKITLTPQQRNSMHMETLQFQAVDDLGELKVIGCGINNLTFIPRFARFPEGVAFLRIEWKSWQHYRY